MSAVFARFLARAGSCWLLALPCAHAVQSQCGSPGAHYTAFPALRQSVDPALQTALDAKLERMGFASAVKRGRLDVTLVDITRPDQPRLAAVNGDTMMYAASLPKIAIMLGAFHRAYEGSLEVDAALYSDIVAMIRHSSNSAATRVLNLVGKEYLARLLQSDRYRLYDPDYDGGLWVGKEYAKKTAWRRDPLNHISHGATSNQVARFFYLLQTDRLVSPYYSQQMKEILGDPGISHKFVAGLRDQRPGSRIYRKSGTWTTFHSDGAIVERDGHCYIAVVLANHPDAGTWAKKIIVALDDLVFGSRPEAIRTARRPSR